MAQFYKEPSRTFNEYLLVPGLTTKEMTVENVSLKTPIVKFRKGEEPPLSANIPLVSAVMQAVSDDNMAVALAKEGGISFIYSSQPVEEEAGDGQARQGHIKPASSEVTATSGPIRHWRTSSISRKKRALHHRRHRGRHGRGRKMVGLVTSRDYRVSRMDPSTPVSEFMTPFEKLVVAEDGVSLKEANDILWDNKLNALPVVDKEQRLQAFVFRKDYDSHKANKNELLDAHKRYIVGAGINTRDYEERSPALVDAGADVLCIDSSEGYSEWQGAR